MSYNQGPGPVSGIYYLSCKQGLAMAVQRAAGPTKDFHALWKEGVLFPSGSSPCNKSSDALLVLRQKGRGRTKDQSGTDFCLVVLPGGSFLFMKSLLRATDEPQVQPLLQTASSTWEEEMTPNLATRGPSLSARPATRWRAESKTAQRR